MADAAKKKAMAKLFKSKKKKTSSKKKAEAEASPVVDESPWETVANETPKETTSKPTKKSLHVGEYDASAEPTGPHIAQVIDAEEATAALTQARINAKKKALLGDSTADAEPAPQSFQERALMRRKQEEAARLRDPSLFPSLGGKKTEPKKKAADIWQLDSVHISEAELEAARPPKLEGEGDEALGLKVVLQPGSRVIQDGEELDKVLKSIAGNYSMMQSVGDLCDSLKEVTPTEELGGLGLRAQILRVFLHDALAENWEPKEMKAVGPGMVALLKAGIIDRAGVREAFEGALMGWYDDVMLDTPKLPELIRTMIEPLVLQRVLRASELPDKVVDACVPKVARLVKEERAKDAGEDFAPAAASGPSAGIPGGPGLSTYRQEQAKGSGGGSGLGAARPKASVGSVFSFLQQAAAERSEPPKAAAPAASAGSTSAAHSSKPSTEAAAPAPAPAAAAADDADAALDDMYAAAGKKKKSKKAKKGADFKLEGEEGDAPAPAAAAVAVAVAPPVVPKVEADPNAAEVLQDLYATAGKKKKKKAKKSSE